MTDDSSKAPWYGPRYFDRDGEPLTVAEWTAMFESGKHSAVARTALHGGRVVVDTIWIGCTFRRDRAGRPLVFETLCTRNGTPFARYDWSTEVAAYAGHYMVVGYIQRDPSFAG